jgi:predicted nucleotide-binding protein
LFKNSTAIREIKNKNLNRAISCKILSISNNIFQKYFLDKHFMTDLEEYKSKFSDSGTQILEEAFRESKRRKQWVGASHILQAFFNKEPRLLESMLRHLSVPSDTVKQTLEKHLDLGRKYDGKGYRISQPITELFKNSMLRARNQGRTTIDSIDILVTLAEDRNSLLNEILSNYDIEPEEATLSVLASNRKSKLGKEISGKEEILMGEKDKLIQKKIFIVHGRDELAKTTIARFLENLKLEPIILHEQSSSSRTLIEKLENYSDVTFAVVLLTPDDVGTLSENVTLTDKKLKEKLSFRARQNVILELGYFIGKLGRNKVCALYKGNIELPTDYSGIVYISMDDNGAWKQILARELKNIGLEVYLEGLLK